MQIFPESVINLWNGWEIRVLVLSSLLLQLILIIFGSRRKYIARKWVSFMVWLAYLSADWVATVALGILASSQTEDSNDCSITPSMIQAFWAPFLLLHLGGPDTITAYALEDNELWLRHLLGLTVEVGVAFYVYLKSWNNNGLTFIAIPVFIAGIVKYGERTWVLRSSTTKQLQASLLSADSLGTKESPSTHLSSNDNNSNFFHEVYYLFRISLALFQDLILGFPELNRTHSIIISSTTNKSSKVAFELVEVELGLIYDVLYTKASIVYTLVGLFLRFISFLSSVVALVIFSIFINQNPNNSALDVALTYLLLVGAVVLEVYALVHLIFSDWTTIWLSKHGHPKSNSISRAVYSLQMHCRNRKRWSGSTGKYSLISSCIKKESPKCLKFFKIHHLMTYMNRNFEYLNDDLKDSIWEHLLKKGTRVVDRINKGAVESGDLGAQLFRDTLLDWRGDHALELEGLTNFSGRFIKFVPFSHSILIWHIATDLCYYNDHLRSDSGGYRTSKSLSDYMMYLLAIRPNMLPKESSTIYAFADTRNAIVDCLSQGEGKKASYKEKDACNKILHRNFTEADFAEQLNAGENKNSLLISGCLLAQNLMSLKSSERMWNVVSEVWIEMLAYAASHCEGKQHARYLRKGGELLTHVCLLMAHLGLSRQFQESYFQRPSNAV